ncbi:hypothetical protein PR003_g4857 [Phytophthora rubi]|uniref:Uncharacterized protein n=1 Tax=Phytophthora rubi TaxID=129364 RepID=A0A6A4FRT0_9STRA|nr:hypothetical protein PR001_g21287 [Phytophthora rubi]KAE9036377.1 hypothetical protein PR002_g7115 [Phytophthora rubi]KAE9351510.1 hypothetical protein PR003_g4857 [Phytophthora rubi]
MDSGPEAESDRLTTYEEELEQWALNDCSAVINSPGDDAMKALFRRWRATRSKPVTVTGTVTPQSLDRAWTSFVSRWNTEGPEAFQQKLMRREEQHSRLSVQALVSQICQLSWDADRECCFAHYRLGCPGCRGYSVVRPSAADWDRITNSTPLSETERKLVELYQRALHEARCDEESRPVGGLSRMPPHSLERPRATPLAAPSYHPSAQASGRGIADAVEWDRRAREYHDPDAHAAERHDDYRRAPRLPPRCCGVAGSAKSARSLVRLTNCARTPTNGGGTPICRDVC